MFNEAATVASRFSVLDIACTCSFAAPVVAPIFFQIVMYDTPTTVDAVNAKALCTKEPFLSRTAKNEHSCVLENPPLSVTPQIHTEVNHCRKTTTTQFLLDEENWMYLNLANTAISLAKAKETVHATPTS